MTKKKYIISKEKRGKTEDGKVYRTKRKSRIRRKK